MARSSSPALRYLRRAALGLHGVGLSDGQLLRAFLHDHDECAFEAFVRPVRMEGLWHKWPQFLPSWSVQ